MTKLVHPSSSSSSSSPGFIKATYLLTQLTYTLRTVHFSSAEMFDFQFHSNSNFARSFE